MCCHTDGLQQSQKAGNGPSPAGPAWLVGNSGFQPCRTSWAGYVALDSEVSGRSPLRRPASFAWTASTRCRIAASRSA